MLPSRSNSANKIYENTILIRIWLYSASMIKKSLNLFVNNQVNLELNLSKWQIIVAQICYLCSSFSCFSLCLKLSKVCKDSWEAQLTVLISWALTARNLVSKIFFQ